MAQKKDIKKLYFWGLISGLCFSILFGPFANPEASLLVSAMGLLILLSISYFPTRFYKTPINRIVALSIMLSFGLLLGVQYLFKYLFI